MNSNTAVFGLLLFVALATLIGFGVWPVAAAILFLVAGLIVRSAGEAETVQKIESRISLIQVGTEESFEKVCKTMGEMSDAISFLRDELRRVATSFEARLSTLEQPRTAETQTYYALVQKIIDLENRVSSIHRAQAQTVSEN